MKEKNTSPSSQNSLKAVTSNLISASAGTGKTYQLASRFVALLALGYKAEEMIALTFTRKAAGEFRNRILKALSDGALDLNEKGAPRQKDDNGKFKERNGMTARVWETWTGHCIKNGKAVPAGNDVPLCPDSVCVMELAAAADTTPEELYAEDDALRSKLGLPVLTHETYQKLLADVVKVMSKLTLSTLDSFFNRIVSGNSLTIGIRQLRPLEPTDVEAERSAVLRDLIAKMPTNDVVAEQFLAQYDMLTDGEGKNMLNFLTEQINDYLVLYRNIKSVKAWGKATEFSLAVPDAEDNIVPPKWEQYEQELQSLYAEVCSAGGNLVKQANSAISALLKNLKKGEFDFLHKHISADNARAGSAFNKFYEAPGKNTAEDKLAFAMENIIREVKDFYLHAVINKTKSLFCILHSFATAYQEHMRSTGKVGFDDIAMFAYHLMNPEFSKSGSHAEQCAYASDRIRYNMDASYNHWMLDEFQDTSNMQFDTLKPLLDEIAMCERNADTKAAARSIFVVGDDKQSIYGFRTGDTHVFDTLQSTDPWKTVLKPSKLEKSYRSAPEIMGENGFINKMFRALNFVEHSITQRDNEELEQTESSERLSYDDKLEKAFADHKSATSKKGYVRISTVPAQDSAEENRNAVYDAVETLLRDELTDEREQPRNGISIAILTRNNTEALELEEMLRERMRRLPVLRLGDNKVAATSQLGEILLSFFMWLLHPDDSYRASLVKASPLCALFEPLSVDESAALSPYDSAQAEIRKTHEKCLQRLTAHGYAAMVRSLLNCFPTEPQNLRQGSTAKVWLTEAHAFDCTGGTLDEWISCIIKAGVAAAGSARYVQIMTMHKSKGLEFDAVILPYIGTKAEDELKDVGYFSLQDAAGDVKALLLNPGSETKRDAWRDIFAPLCAFKQQNSRKEAYNLLYVAATRAKYANYIICHGAELYGKVSKTSKKKEWKAPSRSTGGMIRHMLGFPPFVDSPQLDTEALSAQQSAAILWSDGDSRWYEAEEFLSHSAQQQAAQPLPSLPPLARRYRRKQISPSALSSLEDNPDKEALDKPAPRYGNSSSGADFGTLVHACWEQISWLNEPLPTWVQQPSLPEQKVVAAALRRPDVRALFTHQPGLSAYNEQAIAAVHNAKQEWTNGTIDRLVLTTDTTGKVIAAHIVDFKTNIPAAHEGFARFEDWLLSHYEGQMLAYKKLICKAFDIPPHAVVVSLISCPKGAEARVLTYDYRKLSVD